MSDPESIDSGIPVTQPAASDVTESVPQPDVDHGEHGDLRMQPATLVWVGLALEAALLMVGLLAAWLFNFFDRDRPLDGFFTGAWGSELALGALLSLPLLGAIYVIFEWQLPFLRDFQRLLDDQLVPLFKPLNLWQVAAISISAGVGEEMLFRWCLQGGLLPLVGPLLALLIASVIFGVCHWVTASYALMATLLGGLIGWVYWQWGPLTAIALHAMYDFLAIQFMIKSRPNQPAAQAAFPQSASADAPHQN